MDDMKSCMAECSDQFLAFIKDYMNMIAKQQQENKIKAIHYLSIQPLRVGIRMNKLIFRIQVMEKDFFLGKQEVVKYYYPYALQKRYDEDVASLYQETRKKIIRMQQYEWGGVRNQHAKQYITWIYLMCKNEVSSIMACLEQGDVVISDDFKILFGEYMERSVVLYHGGQTNEIL